MLSLIVAILFGLSITYFAFQNSLGVTINLAGYQFTGVPLYIVVISAVLAGIVMAWFISALEGMSSFMSLRRKDSIINDDKKKIKNLEEKTRGLEAENARLKGIDKEVVADRRLDSVPVTDVAHKPSFFERIFPSSTRRYSKQI